MFIVGDEICPAPWVIESQISPASIELNIFMKYVCNNKKEALFNKPNLSIFTENLTRVPLKLETLKIVDFLKTFRPTEH